MQNLKFCFIGIMGMDPRVAGLRKRMAEASASAKLPQKRGTGFAFKGMRNSDPARMVLVRRIAESNSKNKDIADKLLRIFVATQKGKIVPTSGSPESEHQILVNISLALVRVEKPGKRIVFTPEQREVFERFAKLV